MATVAETLEMAASLIEPEGAWTQGTFARNKHGAPVHFLDESASCFCVIGAVGRVADSQDVKAHARIWLERVGAALPGEYGSNVNWNDAPERTQAEVVSALRAAAAKARES